MNEYNKWNELKIIIDNQDRKSFYIKPREVWNIHTWKNIWYESYWKWDFFTRPVLIIKIVWTMIFTVSMTTNWKIDNKFYHKLDNKYFEKDSFVTLSQVKVLDKKRFIEKIWKIDTTEFIEIKNKLKQILF